MKEVSQLSYEPLMRRFKASLEREVIAQIALSLTPSALAAAGEILGNATQAEDAVQEAFIRLIRCRDQYDESKPFLPWFYTILRNVCRDMQRQEGRRRRILETLSQHICAETVATESMEKEDLLSVLPSGEQEVLRLRILHDFRFREIAAALGISEAAAKKRAQRGLRRLRNHVQSRLYDASYLKQNIETA
jgi:RNA polymerase sigma-70 factor (ECF subfamily)